MNCCEPTGETNSAGVSLADDRTDMPARTAEPHHACAPCGTNSRPVTRKTMLLMLKPEHFNRIGESEYRFCAAPECRVVYFNGAGQAFTTEDLRVRVGLKESSDPIPLCYCFGFEDRHVREEIERTGKTSVPQRISQFIKQRLCACEMRNPSGACCLGEVNKSARRLLAQR